MSLRNTLTLSWLCLASVYGDFSTTVWDDDMLETTSPPNCGSLYVSVEVTSPGNYAGTKVSASVKFPPYSYALVEKELVELAEGDDICSNILTNGDYDNKVLLLPVDESVCSAQSQVVNAESVNIKGVLFYNSIDGNQVYQLDVDDTAATTTIPARMISQLDGADLKLAIEYATPRVEFNCETGDYAQTVCVYDSDGDHWAIDGDYEAQSSLEVNGHPVWQKEGYYTVYSDYYIWLDTDSSNWRWVLSNDTNVTATDRRDQAYCVVVSDNETIDPSICSNWFVYEYENDGSVTEIGEDLVVNGAICEIADSYVCIQSNQNSMRNYEGTYHQIHDTVLVWIRELDSDNDRRLSHILIDDYQECRRQGGGGIGSNYICTNYTGFVLYDEDSDVTAACPFNGTVTYSSPLECKDWYIASTQGGFGGGTTTFSLDSTWDVDDGWCEGYLDTPNTTRSFDNYPTYLCLQDLTAVEVNGTMVYSYSDNQYLYGTFEMETGISYGSHPVYSSPRLRNTSYERYFLLDDLDDMWVLDDEIPRSEQSSINNPTGECEMENINNPAQCTECWEIDNTQSCQLWNVTEGECPETTSEPVSKDNYQESICVTFSTEDHGLDTDANGLYALQNDLYNGRYYYAFINETTGRAFYIYYFDVLRYWVWGEDRLTGRENNINNQLDLFCKEFHEYDLLNCDWEDRGGIDIYDWEIHACTNGSYSSLELDPTRAPQPSPTRNPTTPRPTAPTRAPTNEDGASSGDNTDDQNNLKSQNGVIIALSVTLGIVVLVLVVIGVLYYSKRSKGQAGFGGGFAEEVDDGHVGGLPLSELKDHETVTGGGGLIGPAAEGNNVGGTTGGDADELSEDENDEAENNENSQNSQSGDALPEYVTGGQTDE